MIASMVEFPCARAVPIVALRYDIGVFISPAEALLNINGEPDASDDHQRRPA
jgi:hypothetical protein